MRGDGHHQPRPGGRRRTGAGGGRDGRNADMLSAYRRDGSPELQLRRPVAVAGVLPCRRACAYHRRSHALPCRLSSPPSSWCCSSRRGGGLRGRSLAVGQDRGGHQHRRGRRRRDDRRARRAPRCAAPCWSRSSATGRRARRAASGSRCRRSAPRSRSTSTAPCGAALARSREGNVARARVAQRPRRRGRRGARALDHLLQGRDRPARRARRGEDRRGGRRRARRPRERRHHAAGLARRGGRLLARSSSPRRAAHAARPRRRQDRPARGPASSSRRSRPRSSPRSTRRS